MRFADVLKIAYPGVKVMFLNGEEDEPDINGWFGIAVELPNGKRTAVRFKEGKRHNAEAKLVEWLEANHDDAPGTP